MNYHLNWLMSKIQARLVCSAIQDEKEILLPDIFK